MKGTTLGGGHKVMNMRRRAQQSDTTNGAGDFSASHVCFSFRHTIGCVVGATKLLSSAILALLRRGELSLAFASLCVLRPKKDSKWTRALHTIVAQTETGIVVNGNEKS